MRPAPACTPSLTVACSGRGSGWGGSALTQPLPVPASITRERTEVILQGTASANASAPDATWEDYEFKCKPGDLRRRPCLISPYHHRLDWLMWFAAFQVRPLVGRPRRHRMRQGSPCWGVAHRNLPGPPQGSVGAQGRASLTASQSASPRADKAGMASSTAASIHTAFAQTRANQQDCDPCPGQQLPGGSVTCLRPLVLPMTKLGLAPLHPGPRGQDGAGGRRPGEQAGSKNRKGQHHGVQAPRKAPPRRADRHAC